MKILTYNYNKHKIFIFSFSIFCYLIILASLPAIAQLDNEYGLNTHGLRLSLGGGGNTLKTTWSKAPIGYTIMGSLGYDMSHYFGINIEGQYGKLTGIDGENTFAYSQSVNQYYTASVNLRFSVGLFSDFDSPNAFTDAVKRAYIGAGYGAIFCNIVLTKSNNAFVGTGYVVTADPNTGKITNTVTTIPINIGTNIDIPRVLGLDKVELNPNFQYTIFNATGADGYQPTINSTAGGYALISVSLRYKF